MFGAEVSGVRSVIVMHGPYMIPRPDIQHMAARLAAERNDNLVVDELERLLAGGRVE
jgi:hypothetical protein